MQVLRPGHESVRMSRIEDQGDSLDPYEPHDEHADLIRRHRMIDSRKLSHTDLQTALDTYTCEELSMESHDPERCGVCLIDQAARLVADPNLFMQIKHALGRYTWEHLGNPEHPWDASEATRVVFDILGIDPPEIQSDPRPPDPPTPPPGRSQG